MISRVALAVTWRGGRTAAWRSVLLSAAVAAVALFACAAASAALMAATVHQRAIDRTFRDAAPNEVPDLSGRSIFDSIDGDQIFVELWRIETSGVDIPGIPADAEPGQWFVSPEMLERMASDPRLRSRYPRAQPIGLDGVGAADELMAVRLAGPEAPMDYGSVAEAGDWHSGLDAGVTAGHVAVGAALVLVVGVGLLRAAQGPVSTGLEARLALLSMLGASPARLQQLQAASSAVVAIPAAAGAAAAWHAVSPHLRAVPLVGQEVLAGDLAIPAGAAAGVAAAIVALTVLAGIRRPSPPTGPRPTSQVPVPPRSRRMLPLALSLGCVAYATALSGTSKAPAVFIIGLVSAAASVPIALPVAIDRIGARLANRGSVLALLVGRSLCRNARGSSRSLTALAAVAVLVPAAAAYISVARTADSPIAGPVSVIGVNGNLGSEDVERIEAAADGTFAEVYRLDAAEPWQPPTRTWVGDCDSLRRHMMLHSCGPGGILVETGAAAAFARLDGSSSEVPADAAWDSRLFITRDGRRAENVLRHYMVNSDRLDISVQGADDEVLTEPRSVSWILAAITVGAAAAGAALLLSVVNDAARSAGLRLRLAGIGAEPRMVRRLAASESAATVGIVGLGGAAVGTVVAAAYGLVDGAGLLGFKPSLAVAAVVVAAAAASALASAVCVSDTSMQQALSARD